MPDIEFAKPEYLRLLWPPLILLIVWAMMLVLRIFSRPAKTRFSKFSIIGKAKATLAGLVLLTGLPLALARPQSVLVLPLERNVNIFFIVDGSFSMNGSDISKTRFERSKREIRNFIRSHIHKGDRVGLAVVGRGVGIKSFLSEDPASVLTQLNNMQIDPENADVWGTDLFFGLKTVTDAFEKQSVYDKTSRYNKNRTIFVLFSDGDDGEIKNASPEQQKLKDETFGKLHDLDIPVYTVGVGSTTGTSVTYKETSNSNTTSSFNPMATPTPTPEVIKIYTKLQEITLNEINSRTKGEYFAIRTNQANPKEFFNRILNKERTIHTQGLKKEKEELYPYVLRGCALCMLLIILLI